jgi:maltose-binding protein MalE
MKQFRFIRNDLEIIMNTLLVVIIVILLVVLVKTTATKTATVKVVVVEDSKAAEFDLWKEGVMARRAMEELHLHAQHSLQQMEVKAFRVQVRNVLYSKQVQALPVDVRSEIEADLERRLTELRAPVTEEDIHNLMS